MTIIVEGITVTTKPSKTGLHEGGGTLVLTVGPISGGTPPYSVDFSRTRAHFNLSEPRTRHAVNEVRTVEFSLAGDGIVEYGYAYAVMRFSAKVAQGAPYLRSMYIPPGGFLVVSDSAGRIVTVRSGSFLESSDVV